MKKTLSFQILTAASTLLIGSAAHADLTMKMTMVTSSAAVKGAHLTPHEVKMAKGFLSFENDDSDDQSTTYWSGNKIKVVSPDIESIQDLRTTTMTLLFPPSKTMYATTTVPVIKNHILSVNFIDLKTTKTMLGHKVRLYKGYVNSSLMTVVTYSWIAPDIQSPPVSGHAYPLFDNIKVSGTPLKVSDTTVFHSEHIKVTMVYQTTAISSAPIPVSVFTIPSDYKTIPSPEEELTTLQAKLKEQHAMQSKKGGHRRWVPGHYE